MNKQQQIDDLAECQGALDEQIDDLAECQGALDERQERLEARIRALELQADAKPRERGHFPMGEWVSADAIEARLRKLEEASREWVDVKTRVVPLETHASDQRGTNRRLSARIHALEQAVPAEQQRAFLAARLRGSTPPVARPSSWLMYELWRSAVPHPRGEPYKGSQAKLIERTIVPNPEDSYFSFPANYAELKGYPTGYHWLVKDNGETIVAIAVNEAPPNPMQVKR